jgi:hypothetical protein
MCRLCGLPYNFKIFCARAKKIKTRSVGLSFRQVSQPLLSELVVFVCLSTGQNLLSSVGLKSCRVKVALSSNSIAHNGLPLAAVGDFEKLNCQQSTKVDRSTALQLTTSAPIAANGCYAVGFLFLSVVSLSITTICPRLNWRTLYCPVATIHATVALFWL